jgi:NAD(P)-dependent dehydrogenase (short-subunit alcohol dehydrogenase family)
MQWTINNIPDLSGKTAIVTGANSGLGFHITLALAKKGCQVIMACRDLRKGTLAQHAILAQIGHANIQLEKLDLADLASIHTFTSKMQTSHPSLSLLINNAGIMAIPYRKTKDNFEMQFGVNHLGHFTLTGLLLPLLLKEQTARIATMSSVFHRWGKMEWDNLQGEKSYQARQAYCNSKLANLLFTFELNRRLQEHRHSQISVAAHPGYSATNLQYVGAEMERNNFKKALRWITNVLFAQSAAQGALPMLYACTADGVKGGEYYGPDGLGEIRGYSKLVNASAQANDPIIAKQLWDRSESLTGVKYTF